MANHTALVRMTQLDGSVSTVALFDSKQSGDRATSFQNNPKLWNAISEFIDNEHSYTETLKIIQEVYYDPLQDGKIITNQTRKMSIPKMTDFIQLEIDFCKSLEQGISDQKIGEYLLPFAEKMKIYQDYVNGHESRKKSLDQLIEKNSKFRDFVEEARKNERCKRLHLADLLIQPVQHIPRVIMQLEQIHKRMPNDHPDGKFVEQAIETYKLTAKQLNLKKKEEDSRLKMFEIQQLVQGCPDSLIKHARLYVGEYDVDEVDLVALSTKLSGNDGFPSGHSNTLGYLASFGSAASWGPSNNSGTINGGGGLGASSGGQTNLPTPAASSVPLSKPYKLVLFQIV